MLEKIEKFYIHNDGAKPPTKPEQKESLKSIITKLENSALGKLFDFKLIVQQDRSVSIEVSAKKNFYGLNPKKKAIIEDFSKGDLSINNQNNGVNILTINKNMVLTESVIPQEGKISRYSFSEELVIREMDKKRMTLYDHGNLPEEVLLPSASNKDIINKINDYRVFALNIEFENAKNSRGIYTKHIIEAEKIIEQLGGKVKKDRKSPVEVFWNKLSSLVMSVQEGKVQGIELLK